MPKPRKKYRPRWLPNPLAYKTAILGASMMTIDDVLAMANKARLAVDELAKAETTKQTWQELFDACNLLEQLIKDGKAQDPDGLIDATQEVLVTALERRNKGIKALKSAELGMLRDFCAAYTQVLGTLTNREVFEAYEAVVKRVARVLAERKPSNEGRVFIA